MIGNRFIGADYPAFVVAEVGLNHNGELERALEMVHIAAQAGCDAVKFQTFKAAEFVNDPLQMFTYRSQGSEVTESMLAMFQRFELSDDAWPVIKEECLKAGIIFLSTPQNLSDLDILLKVGVPAVKVGSDDFTNLPLLNEFAKSGLPLILSSGMSDLADVHQALETIGALDGYPAILLACTSQYPTPPEDVNLARIITLQAAFPMIPIGFSDHSQGSLASSLAVALGACLFEKHFTLSHDLPGPDHWFSEEPDGLASWVDNIRTSQKMLGNPLVRPTSIERRNRLDFQRRIVASRDIRYGEILDETALTFRRVAGGHGLPPVFIKYILGRLALRTYRAGEPIEFGG